MTTRTAFRTLTPFAVRSAYSTPSLLGMGSPETAQLAQRLIAGRTFAVISPAPVGGVSESEALRIRSLRLKSEMSRTRTAA